MYDLDNRNELFESHQPPPFLWIFIILSETPRTVFMKDKKLCRNLNYISVPLNYFRFNLLDIFQFLQR
jgi:hypothetical protein